MPTSPSQPEQASPATFWQREAAWGLEFVPLQLLIVLLTFFLPAVWGFFVTVLLFLGYILLNAYMESVYGGNVGKYILGLKVCTTEGDMLTFSQALFRQTACGISWATMNIGHMMAMIRPDKKALHDLMTQTHVIQQDIDIPSLPYVFPNHRPLWMTVSFASQILFTLVLTIVSVMHALTIVENAMNQPSVF